MDTDSDDELARGLVARAPAAWNTTAGQSNPAVEVTQSATTSPDPTSSKNSKDKNASPGIRSTRDSKVAQHLHPLMMPKYAKLATPLHQLHLPEIPWPALSSLQARKHEQLSNASKAGFTDPKSTPPTQEIFQAPRNLWEMG